MPTSPLPAHLAVRIGSDSLAHVLRYTVILENRISGLNLTLGRYRTASEANAAIDLLVAILTTTA